MAPRRRGTRISESTSGETTPSSCALFASGSASDASRMSRPSGHRRRRCRGASPGSTSSASSHGCSTSIRPAGGCSGSTKPGASWSCSRNGGPGNGAFWQRASRSFGRTTPASTRSRRSMHFLRAVLDTSLCSGTGRLRRSDRERRPPMRPGAANHLGKRPNGRRSQPRSDPGSTPWRRRASARCRDPLRCSRVHADARSATTRNRVFRLAKAVCS